MLCSLSLFRRDTEERKQYQLGGFSTCRRQLNNKNVLADKPDFMREWNSHYLLLLEISVFKFQLEKLACCFYILFNNLVEKSVSKYVPNTGFYILNLRDLKHLQKIRS